MPALVPVETTDTLDIWRQKINDGFNQVNNIPSPSTNLITLVNPVNEGDVLLYNATDAVFNNTQLDTQIQDYLDSQSIVPYSEIEQLYLSTMAGIY